MSVDKAELCGSLLTWLQTFHVPSPCASPQDLSSGLAVAYVLNQIDPSWFNEAWLQGISEDPGPNWKLKVTSGLLIRGQTGEEMTRDGPARHMSWVMGRKRDRCLVINHLFIYSSIEYSPLKDIKKKKKKNRQFKNSLVKIARSHLKSIEHTLPTEHHSLPYQTILDRGPFVLSPCPCSHPCSPYSSPLCVQVQELQGQWQEEAMKAEKWLFECRNLEEKYESVTKEKERLLAERDSLREANEELRCAQLQPRGLIQADSSLDPTSPPVDNLAAEILPAELRYLGVTQNSGPTQACQGPPSAPPRLPPSTSPGCLVEDLQKALQEQGGKTEDVSSILLKRKLEEHLQKLHEADLELQRKREYIEELEPPTDSSTARRIEELQHNLQKKDADLRAMEERYRRYVDKARMVMQSMEPKQRPAAGAPPELHSLRTQLRERDVRIRHLEVGVLKSCSSVPVWGLGSKIGMALQQRAGEERVPAHAQSFLAQQRLATNARRGPLGRLASLNLRPNDKH
uniref:Hook microtubule tethering protein 2 n=1 Tax=Nomascus leucogenys TaxID=61853 RepID=G1RQL9_NOMLE